MEQSWVQTESPPSTWGARIGNHSPGTCQTLRQGLAGTPENVEQRRLLPDQLKTFRAVDASAGFC